MVQSAAVPNQLVIYGSNANSIKTTISRHCGCCSPALFLVCDDVHAIYTQSITLYLL